MTAVLPVIGAAGAKLVLSQSEALETLTDVGDLARALKAST
jgi:hypothetical protein